MFVYIAPIYHIYAYMYLRLDIKHYIAHLNHAV